MKKRLSNIISLLLCLSLVSCATLFNSPITCTRVVTNLPSKLTVNGEKKEALLNQHEICIKRTNEPLVIIVESKETKKTVKVNAKKDIMFWANIYNYGFGALIDLSNSKRYCYPKTIFLDLKDSLSTYQTQLPYSKKYDSLKNQIKFTPLKLIGLVNPGLEIAFERKTSSQFSTQFMGSVLFDYNNQTPTLVGFRTAIEEKFFYKKSAPIGPYLGFEINYLQKKYYDTWMFGVANVFDNPNYQNTNYIDRFGINKKTLSFNLKWGFQTIFNRFVIDFYAGLGLVYREVHHFDRINPNDEMEATRHPNLYYISNREANEWSLSLPLNVKIGWAF